MADDSADPVQGPPVELGNAETALGSGGGAGGDTERERRLHEDTAANRGDRDGARASAGGPSDSPYHGSDAADAQAPCGGASAGRRSDGGDRRGGRRPGRDLSGLRRGGHAPPHSVL